MKSKRLPQNSYETNQSLAEFAVRGGFLPIQEIPDQESKGLEVSQILANCFPRTDKELLSLQDEFSSRTIRSVISTCRELLQEASENPRCWTQLRAFLEDELWKFSRIKEELAEVEKKCGMLHRKLDEISHPLDGQRNGNRLMACVLLLEETKMRRDHLQDRVSMVIDEFVTKILAGTQNAPGGDVLEIRLRGVFGSL